MASVTDVLQTMSGKTVTLGWDVVVGYDAASINDLFAQQYVANVKQNANLQPISATISLAEGVQVQLVNVILGPPLISFDAQLANQQATITMNFVSGDVLVVEQSGSVQYVSAYQSIVPGDQYALQMTVDLAQVQGDVTASKEVVVDLQNASQCTVNLLPGTSDAAYLGTYFQSFLAKEAQGELTYQLGALTMGTSEDLVPTSFEIRTQPNPATTSDGAVLLFVATTYNPGGGQTPDATLPYFIPSDYGCFVFVGSKTLFGNVMPSYFSSVLQGSPTFAVNQGSGSNAASWLAFTGGNANCGTMSAEWTSGNVNYRFWAGSYSGPLSPVHEDVLIPFDGLSIEPSNDLLTVNWSTSWSQKFAGWMQSGKFAAPSSSNVSINVTGSFTATPEVSSSNDNLIQFSGSGSPAFTWQQSDWFQKYCGNGNVRDGFATQMASFAKPVAKSILSLKLPQVNTFAVDHLLFPAENVVQLSEAYVPGDLACFGTIEPASTFALSPLQSVIAAGQTVQFTASNGVTVSEWGMNPIRGTIASGLYTAPSFVPSSTPVVITATSADNDVATAIVMVVPSPVTISPAFTMVFPNDAPVPFTAAVLGGGTVTWSVAGSGSIDANGLYTPPSTVPAGVSIDTITASAGSESATATVALVNAVLAFALDPPYAALGANGAQAFTTSGATYTWSVSPASAGSVDQNGNYSAPYEIAQNTTALIVAQDASDASLVGTAIVILTAG